MELYNLLENLLDTIELNLTKDIDVNSLSTSLFISPIHLNRIFKFAFGTTIPAYIRSRRLSESLNDLINMNDKIIDIATRFGFDYEQSYIRAFKREFGITPGDERKSKLIVKVTPPIKLFNSSKLSNGVLFGPEIVMVPEFHIVGTKHSIPYTDAVWMAPKVAIDFWNNDKCCISNIVNPNVYIGYTINSDENDYSFYYPSVQVCDLSNIPSGFYCNTFNTSLCARFHYIGNHHYYDINAEVASEMYNEIYKFSNDESQRYGLLNNSLYFERIDTYAYNGEYCTMEWFSPVFNK